MRKPRRQEPAPESAPPQAPPVCPIVGVGASAGGIDALKHFLPAIERDCGMAFVLVQHLDPDHRSALPELLAHISPLQVVPIEEDIPVEENHFYVIPSNATLTIESGRLHLATPVARRGFRTPIDTFFVSLAEERAEKAACVILSGTGSDGTLGLRAIKEHGGLTLAQEGAQYDGMMRSALATGLVDFVLPAEAIPPKLAAYFRYIDAIGGKKGPDGFTQKAADALTQLCGLLRARTGNDFTGYKDKTVLRRVQRRMQVLQIDNVQDFVGLLRKEPREIDLLFQDLLIGVTNFFRDPQVFAALEKQVIPRLFEGKGPDVAVRVWVPGCATGEAAYSIAMLLREHVPKSHAVPRLQIFASDIDEHALESARTGRYPATIAKDVPRNLLERCFLREDGTYRVVGDLREICLFSVHNVLRDAPFSKLDLLSCRNLLIYLSPEIQNRLIPLFHYALIDGGYLLLGSSENVTRQTRLFSAVDKENRIFKRRPQAGRQLPDFPLTAPDTRRLPAPTLRRIDAAGGPREQAERLLLERYAPPYVVIDADGDILHASAHTGKYLELPAGPPSSNIFGMARRGLRLDLRAAIHQAIESGQPTLQTNVGVGTNGGEQLVNLIVHPLGDGGGDGLCMIVFQDIGGLRRLPETENAATVDDTESANVRQLEADLRATRDRLQATTEELESSNEELKSGNEELQSINEELQSANEELETCKEELQSINEELQTVNAELKARVDELSRANSDIANLLESTQIATVFLDRQLAVKSFTPAAKDVFHLVESDVGRPISHVRARLRLDTILDDAERVIRTLGTIEDQVETEDGTRRYIMRILPYRTVENVIAGVVLNFIDVTRITAAEREIVRLTRDLRDRVESVERILDLVPVGILIVGTDPMQRAQVNRYGARLIHDEDGSPGPRDIAVPYRLFQDERELPFWEQPLQRAAYSGQPVPATEGRLVRHDGSVVDVIMQAEPLLDEQGAPRGAIAAIVDISERKKAESTQLRLTHELRHRVKNILATVAALAARMLASGSSLDEFAAAFHRRLLAMGRLHELLSDGLWEGTDLRSLASAVLAPYANTGNDNVELSGANVVLHPNEAVTLGLVLNELASNAAKYGALSVPAGRAELAWTVREDAGKKWLSLAWKERNGPRIEAFPSMGFGTRFIVQCIDYELEGVAKLTFHPDGLLCEIEFLLHDRDGTS